MENTFPLTDITRALKQYTDGPAVPYRRLYNRVIDGVLPAERDDTGKRWMIDRNDIPVIAKTLGLKEKTHA